ncbi:MAG TPA: S41 family peptidase [Bacteroidia bacterium]|nr:S41 family peptidase [Bacteroidia bacterium]
MIGTFGVYHYKPIPINETTSAETVDLFIKDLDHVGIVLKQSDVNALQVDKIQLFSQINSNNESYFKNAKLVYSKALFTVDSLLTVLSSKKLNFTENDTAKSLALNAKTFYSPSIKYHLKRLERNIKSRCFERVANLDGYEKLTEQEFNDKASEFSKTIIANFQKNIKEMLSDADKTVESNLLNAIALRHDPHSNYFNQEQNKEFNKQLSAQVESFGFYLSEDDDGNIIIAYIEPGGSAWVSNEVNEGDLFISLKLGGIVITNEGNTADDIQEKLEKTNESKLDLTLKKQNGQLKTVKLIKQKTASVDNSVKGYILKNKSGNIGYISLPSFYTDMEQNTAPGCANDVAKEILKLENDTITGLIIDLRNNGGGSMLEAMNLAGIFVDEGPLFIYKEKNRKPTLIKDINRGSIFKKPLVVMINETSASASELFSNIVKDYNLGLVVGQTSYGKGTAQTVMPLDTNLLRVRNGSEQATDFIKVTQAKFYRLNNSTHQGAGVVPDIVLPSSPGYSIYKESKEAFFLESDIVTKNVVYNPNPAINVTPLQQKSSERIQKSQDFKRYKQCSDSILDFLNNPPKFVLKYKEFKKYKVFTDNLYSSFESANQSSSNDIKCLNNTFDKKITEVSEQTKEFNAKVRESIEKDIFINEAFYIIIDLKQMSN